MKKIISGVLMSLLVVSLASCAKAEAESVSASEETSVSTPETEKEQSDVSKNFSFTSVGGDKQTASVSAVEPEVGKVKTPYGGEEYAKAKFGDLDGDGAGRHDERPDRRVIRRLQPAGALAAVPAVRIYLRNHS